MSDWLKVNEDNRGYTNIYECPFCHRWVNVEYTKVCNYDYCPYCQKRVN